MIAEISGNVSEIGHLGPNMHADIKGVEMMDVEQMQKQPTRVTYLIRGASRGCAVAYFIMYH